MLSNYKTRSRCLLLLIISSVACFHGSKGSDNGEPILEELPTLIKEREETALHHDVIDPDLPELVLLPTDFPIPVSPDVKMSDNLIIKDTKSKLADYLNELRHGPEESAIPQEDKVSDTKEDNSSTENTPEEPAQPQKVNCTLRSSLNNSIEADINSVIMVNDTTLQQLLKDEKNMNNTSHSQGAVCQTLLLYAPWCVFSSRLAPHYHALSRVFPDLEVLAINAVTLNYWNARFGTVAVPNVLLFHNGKFIAKFNHTEKNIEGLSWFIQNFTILNATGDADNLLEIDFQGPVPIEAVPQTDYYLILSGLVILFSIGYAGKQYQDSITAAYHRLTNLFHYDHPHLD